MESDHPPTPQGKYSALARQSTCPDRKDYQSEFALSAERTVLSSPVTDLRANQNLQVFGLTWSYECQCDKLGVFSIQLVVHKFFTSPLSLELTFMLQ